MAAEGNVFSSLGINPVILVGQIINFLILMFILTKFLYKPILKVLDERAKLIAKGNKAAEDSIKHEEEIEAEKQKELAKVQQEVEKIMASAKADATAMKEDIIAEAKSEADKLIEKQKAALDAQFERQEKELQEKVVDISAEMAKQILKQFVDKKTQDQIVDTQLKKLAAQTKTA